MDLVSNRGSLTTPSSYLQSRVPIKDTSSVFDGSEAAQAMQESLVRQAFQTQYNEDPGSTGLGRATRYAAAGLLDVGDQLASILPSIERGEIWGLAKDAGMTGMADFRERNRTGVEMTSGIATAVAGGWLAEVYLLPTLARAAAASTALTSTRMYQWGTRMLPSARAAALEDITAAARLGTSSSLLAPAGRQLMSAVAMREGGKAAFHEGVFAFLNQNNEQMISEDWGENLFWAGVGIAAGGTLGMLQGRAMHRLMAADESITAIRQQALDPSGVRKILDAPLETLGAMVKSKSLKTEQVKTTQALSSELTVQAFDAYTDISHVAEPVLKQKLTALQTQSKQSVELTLQKMSKRGIEDVKGTGFDILGDSDVARDALHMVKKNLATDPTMFLGFAYVGIGNATDIMKARADHIALLSKAGTPAQQGLANRLKRQTPWINVDGHWLPASAETAGIQNFDPKSIKLKTPQNQQPGQFSYIFETPSGRTLRLDTTGKLRSNKSYDQFSLSHTLEDTLAHNEAYVRLSANMRKAGAKQPRFVVGLNEHDWRVLDFALYHKSKGGLTQVNGLPDDDAVRFQSLKLKADFVKKNLPNGMSYVDRLRLNLPLPSSLERLHDETSGALRHVLRAVSDGKIKTYADAQEAYRQALTRSDLAKPMKDLPSLDGGAFEFNRNKDGRWQPTLFGYEDLKHTDRRIRGTQEHMAEAYAVHKLAVAADALKAPVNPSLEGRSIVTDVANLSLSPAGKQMSGALGLGEDTMTGLSPGRGYLGPVSTEIGGFLPTTFRGRDNPVITAIMSFGKTRDQMVQRLLQAELDKVNPIVREITSSVNRKSAVLFDQFASFRPGWDLVRDGAERLNDGMHYFKLADTPHNRESFEQLGLQWEESLTDEFGDVIEEGVNYMPNHITKKPIVLDDLGMKFLNQFQDLSDARLFDANKLRSMNGQAPLERVPYYINSRDTKGKFIGFTIDKSTGQAVRGKAVVADNAAEFERLKNALQDGLAPNEQFFTMAELENLQDYADRAAVEFSSAYNSLRMRQKAKGTLVGETIQQNSVHHSLDWVRRQIEAQARDATRLMNSAQIRTARQMQNVGLATEIGQRSSSGFGKSAKKVELPQRTIHTEYLKALMGEGYARAQPTLATSLGRGFEALAQSLVNVTWMGGSGAAVGRRVSELVGMAGLKLNPKEVRDYDSLVKALGNHMPYATLDHYIKDVVQAKVPPQVRELTDKMNQFSAAMLLRWLELPNAFMNIAGLVTNMPSVLRNSRTPIIGELTASNGTKVGIVDSYKIIAKGIKDCFDPNFTSNQLKYAAEHGYLDQTIHEYFDAVAGIHTQTDFNRILMGDKTIDKNAPRFSKDWFKRNGIDGLLSLATDSTEKFSRVYSHTVGYRMAELSGIMDEAGKHDFARSFADSVVASYSPYDRGEAFNTAVGSLYGLFTTYMMAYNTRLFRWMETGNYESVVRQLSWQASLFGMESVPGFDAIDGLKSYIDGAGEKDDPAMTLTDKMYAGYGPLVGSVIAHGSISAIPRLFGAPGVALYTRGDANIRAPSLNPADSMVAVGVLSRMGKGMIEMGQAALAGSGDNSIESAALMSEALARMIPNRVAKGIYNIAVQDGTEVDSYGQVMASSNGMMESLYRMLGTRSTRQQDQLNFYYANRAQLDKMAGRMEMLRKSTRAAMRNGNVDLAKVFEDYVRNGGNPEHFKTWINGNWEGATTERALRQAQKSMANPAMVPMAARISWSQ